MTAVAASVALLRGGRRDAGRTASGAPVLTLAMIASGVLTYAFLVLAARTLSKDAYSQIGVLWAAMFLGAIVLFRPLEQTASRAIAHRLAEGQEVRSAIRSVLFLAAGTIVAFVAACAVAWDSLARHVFGSSNALTAAFVAGVALYGASYVVRGVLGGARWFEGYAIGIVADGGVRLLFALPLLFNPSREIAAVAVVAAGCGGAVAPLVCGARLLRRRLQGAPAEAYRSRTAVSFAAPATVVAAADQLLVNGGPLLVIAGGASRAGAAAGLVFAATMLVRAPIYVFQGFAAALLPNLTHLAATGGRKELRRAVVRIAGAFAVVGAVLVPAAAVGGPAIMRAVYGGAYDADARSLMLLTASVAFYLAAGTFSQALLALGKTSGAAAGWTLAAVSFVGAYAAIPGAPLTRVAAALALGCLIGAIALATSLLRSSG